MPELQIWTEFFEGEKDINIVQLDDKAFWFQASHLCKLLGYKNVTVALQTHCEDYEIQKFDIGKHEDVNFVSESGFYSLVLGSTKPKAKIFKKWVCSEILPKLRASGGYIMPTATSEQLEALQTEISHLQNQNRILSQEHCYSEMIEAFVDMNFTPAENGKYVTINAACERFMYWIENGYHEMFNPENVPPLDRGRFMKELARYFAKMGDGYYFLQTNSWCDIEQAQLVPVNKIGQCRYTVNKQIHVMASKKMQAKIKKSIGTSTVNQLG